MSIEKVRAYFKTKGIDGRIDVEVYLDISLKCFHIVFPACGSSNSAIELLPQELEELCRYYIKICS